MNLKMQGVREHNLKNINVEFFDGLTAVTGVSGSGKSSLIFDTLYKEAKRRFNEVFHPSCDTFLEQPVNMEKISGLIPTIALGQNLINRNPNSIVASAVGIHVLLRILFSRFGTRFCGKCGYSLQKRSKEELSAIIKNCTIPFCLKSAVIRNVKGSHKTLISELSGLHENRRYMILKDGRAISKTEVLNPDIGHTIEILLYEFQHIPTEKTINSVFSEIDRMGLSSLIIETCHDVQEFSLINSCIQCQTWFPEISTSHFSAPCPLCGGKNKKTCRECLGTGLHPLSIGVKWEGFTLSEILEKTIAECRRIFSSLKNLRGYPRRILNEIFIRLEAMDNLGLGYISLDRQSPTLSRGEAQRLRLSVALISKLEDVLHVLDEPAIGQHPSDVAALIKNFRTLAGPVIFIEHDKIAVAQADRVLDIGPGAAGQGGEVVFYGRPDDLWKSNTLTGKCFRHSIRSSDQKLQQERGINQEYISIKNGWKRNLKGIDISIPLCKFTVVTGVSGSGKSTLVGEVLGKSLEKGKAHGCDSIDCPPLKPVYIDQSPIGKNPRSNPATYTKCSKFIQDLFSLLSNRSGSGFSPNSQDGACPVCKGIGATEIAMKFLPSIWITCSACEGKKFNEDIVDLKIPLGDKQYSIVDIYESSINDCYKVFDRSSIDTGIKNGILRHLRTLIDVGLGYISLGQTSPSLSGGEAQRVKLAKFLGKKVVKDQIVILDEPTTGLHPHDVKNLLDVLWEFVQRGVTILAVEHNTDVIRFADWIIDLGPGAGPFGGELIFQGCTSDIYSCKKSLTGKALNEENIITPQKNILIKKNRSREILLQNVRTNNLKNISVRFKKNALNVVTGVSGSGKSSLVHETLEREAKKRYLESLSMYERQNTREKKEACFGEMKGLGLSISIGSEKKFYNPRATVGTITGIGFHLGVLFAFAGEKKCPRCDRMLLNKETFFCTHCQYQEKKPLPRYFSSNSYLAACTKCHGIGTMRKPNPSKLIIHPEKPLCAGAMYSPGFFPRDYCGKPYNGGYDLVQGLGKKYKFDPFKTPWADMSEEAQKAFLFGSREEMLIHYKSRTGRESKAMSKFPGFYYWINDWDLGGTYTDTEICPSCGGAKLKNSFLSIKLNQLNYFQYHCMPLEELFEQLTYLKKKLLSRESLRKNIITPYEKTGFLNRVGLGYINLNRLAKTLSAGEAQRIRLASLMGNEMTGITVVLDEPTRGMHQSEVQALIGCLKDMKTRGNTIVTVEHDPDVIKSADRVIDLGPGSGSCGGNVLYQGPPNRIENTTTAKWLTNKKKYLYDSKKKSDISKWFTIEGAAENNLQEVTVNIPLG
ncbi:MAG: ATP-binding cassette domain-containing protein, partial [Chitinispirillia bacterium]